MSAQVDAVRLVDVAEVNFSPRNDGFQLQVVHGYGDDNGPFRTTLRFAVDPTLHCASADLMLKALAADIMASMKNDDGKTDGSDG